MQGVPAALRPEGQNSQTILGSEIAAEIAQLAKPRYHFAAGQVLLKSKLLSKIFFHVCQLEIFLSSFNLVTNVILVILLPGANRYMISFCMLPWCSPEQ